VVHWATVPLEPAVTGRRRRSTDSSAKSLGSTLACFSIRPRAARTSLGRFMLAAATTRPSRSHKKVALRLAGLPRVTGVPPEERTPDFMQQRAADVR
jgi:hypothetical protein